jgi:hypothetical protein
MKPLHHVQNSDNEFSRPFYFLNNHLSDFTQVALFDCSGCRKWFRRAFRHLETSLHPLQQSRFFRRPEGRLWDIRAICLLKTSLKDQVAFSLQKWVRMVFLPLETSLHLIHPRRFLRRPKSYYEFTRPFAYLQLHFRSFYQIAFLNV